MALGIAGDAAGLAARALAMARAGAAMALLALSPSPATHAGAATISDGRDLLRAMHHRYQHDWYETLTFEQTSTTHDPGGGSKSEIWHEAVLLPGKLRIDIGEPGRGNGALVADGTLTRFQAGKVTSSRPLVHMLLVLGFPSSTRRSSIPGSSPNGTGRSELARLRRGASG